jgi:hypothetical protein
VQAPAQQGWPAPPQAPQVPAWQLAPPGPQAVPSATQDPPSEIPLRTQQPLPHRLPGQQGWPGFPQAWQVRGVGMASGSIPGGGGGPGVAQIASGSSQSGRAEARQHACPFCPHPH